MLQLALRTLRFRAGMFVAAFLAMFFAAAIMMACGGLIETGIRTAVPPQQMASADVVVTGDQEYRDSGGDPDEPPILPERVHVDAGLADTIAALPGVRKTESFVFEGDPPPGTVDAIGVVAKPGGTSASSRSESTPSWTASRTVPSRTVPSEQRRQPAPSPWSVTSGARPNCARPRRAASP